MRRKQERESIVSSVSFVVALQQEMVRMVKEEDYTKAQALAWVRIQLIGNGYPSDWVDDALNKIAQDNGVEGIRFA